MASPFSYFRRNQRMLMALLTLAAMFTFVCVGFVGFGVPQLLQLLGISGGHVRDPVVVRTNWTTLRASDLHGPGGLIARRILANNFLAAVQRRAIQFAAFPGFGAPTEEEVVIAEVLRHKAQQMGLSVDDEAVDKFLRAITRDQLTPEEFIAARTDLNVSDKLVYGVLRDELLAYNAGQLLGLTDDPSRLEGNAPPMTPDELREYYHKLRDQAEIEAVAVPAEAFVDQVEAPSEGQLRVCFERYREFFALPFSPMPGFRQHRRIQVEYIRADFEKTVEAITVSDADVEAYYEKNKDAKYRLPDASDSSTEKKKDAEAGDDTHTNKSPEKTPEPEKPAAPDSSKNPPDAASKSDETQPSGETPKLFPDPSEKPADEQPSHEADPDAANSSQADQGGAAQPPAAPKTASGPEAGAGTASPASGQPAPTPAAPAAPSAAQQPAAGPSAPSQQEKTAKDDSAERAEGGQPASKPQEEKPAGERKAEPRYRELDDELREEIRAQLKRTRARELIDELFGDLRYDVFDGYNEQYAEREAGVEEAQEKSDGAKAQRPSGPPPAPAPLDVLGQRIEGARTPSELLERAVEAAKADARFQNVALSYGKTGLLNGYEITDLEGIGKARECTRDEAVRRDAPPFGYVAFHLSDLYVAAEVCEIGEEEENPSSVQAPEKSNTYLFWKIADEPEFTPKQLSEVRDQVERAWRLEQARRRARERAGQLAEIAKQKGASLAESLAGEKVNSEGETVVSVLHPPAFHWLSRPEGQLFAAPGVTDVEGIKYASEAFMRTVFSLSEGEVGVAADAPEKTFYVVRVDVMHLAPRNELLRENFFGFLSEYEQIGQQLAQSKRTRLVRQLSNEAGLKWENREGG